MNPIAPILPSALQLWSIRNEMNAGARQALEAVAGMGYRRVELAGFGDLPDSESVARAVRDAGLEMVATHVPVEFFRKDLLAVIRDTQVLGTRRVVCPILPAECFADATACEAAGREFDGFSREMAKHGLTLSYHIHGRGEFGVIEGRTALARMLEFCPGLEIEMDVLWVARAGLCPAQVIRESGARGTLVHLKDMAADGTSIDFGSGTLDLAGIVAAVCEVGAAAEIIVEQEHFPQRSPMAAAEHNLRHLETLLAAAAA